MESDSSSIYTPENLYGEYVEEMLSYLSLKPSSLVGETALKFQNIIHDHCERSWISKESVLPSFGDDGDWLNTRRPLEFEGDLRSRVFVMDFFTYCCINCIHILPFLKEVECEHAQNPAFTVIGVHSPKFPNEKHLERVKDAVIRNDIKHPVLNDPDSKLWKAYGINCWPTVFIVGPGHTLLFILVGEAQIDKLSFLCHHVLKYFESCSVELDLSPLPILPLEEPKTIDTGLLFPGSVSAIGNNCLVVSDTGHNRLLVMSKTLKVQETIGCGESGCNDGPFNSASFNIPNGTALFSGVLYVADTGNHSIRKVDFENKTVSTVFRREDYVDNSQKESDNKVTFQSPWDVCVGPKLGSDLSQLNTLYIAVAGSHQIWALDLDSDPSEPGFCVPFAGSGREENKQNLYRLKAGFAQPCGIAYSPCSPDFIYVADSESSTIKSLALKNNGAVQVVVGGSRDPLDLFQFGDQDGINLDAKLQHPMGVCVLGLNILAVADTYNHKIKIIDANTKKCVTLRANIKLCEPSSLCVTDNSDLGISEKKVFVADTNNHQIVPIHLYEHCFSELVSQEVDLEVESHALAQLNDPPQTEFPLAYDGVVFCHFKWNFRSGLKMNPHGGGYDKIKSDGDGVFKFVCMAPELEYGEYQPSLKIVSEAKQLEKKEVENPKSKIIIVSRVPVCDESNDTCSYTKAVFKMVVKFSKSGPKCVNMFFTADI